MSPAAIEAQRDWDRSVDAVREAEKRLGRPLTEAELDRKFGRMLQAAALKCMEAANAGS